MTVTSPERRRGGGEIGPEDDADAGGRGVEGGGAETLGDPDVEGRLTGAPQYWQKADPGDRGAPQAVQFEALKVGPNQPYRGEYF